MVICPQCKGNDYYIECQECYGHGTLIEYSVVGTLGCTDDYPYPNEKAVTCEHCNGEGEIKVECDLCNGDGEVDDWIPEMYGYEKE